MGDKTVQWAIKKRLMGDISVVIATLDKISASRSRWRSQLINHLVVIESPDKKSGKSSLRTLTVFLPIVYRRNTSSLPSGSLPVAAPPSGAIAWLKYSVSQVSSCFFYIIYGRVWNSSRAGDKTGHIRINTLKVEREKRREALLDYGLLPTLTDNHTALNLTMMRTKYYENNPTFIPRSTIYN